MRLFFFSSATQYVARLRVSEGTHYPPKNCYLSAIKIARLKKTNDDNAAAADDDNDDDDDDNNNYNNIESESLKGPRPWSAQQTTGQHGLKRQQNYFFK